MNLINLTPIHYIGILYMSFAHQTDGIYSRSEHTSVWKVLKKWMPKDFEYSEFLKIMDEITEWYKNRLLEDNFKETLSDIAAKMNDYEWFTMQKKEESLKDLRSIALADKKFLDAEKKWMRDIAKTWNIDSRFITKIVK